MVISVSSTLFKKFLPYGKENERGFTLVEIVVTIGITSLLLMSISISGSSVKREFTLSKSQEELRGLITYARFLSVATLAAPEKAQNQLVCGYGVRIVSNPAPGEPSAYIFRDKGTNNVCVEGIGGDPEESLASEGSLYSMTLDSLVVFDSNQKILFIPPDPTVAFDSGTGDPEGGTTITIQARDGSNKNRKVQVLASGMISIVR